MAKDVLCEVHNCHYWKAGNQCGADRIYVVSQHGQKAASEEETDCQTFMKR